MSLDAALFSATSGLRHTSRGLANASDNIAKAGVEGYTRKQVAGDAMATGGVRSLQPTRDVDLALRAEAMSARSQAGFLGAWASGSVVRVGADSAGWGPPGAVQPFQRRMR